MSIIHFPEEAMPRDWRGSNRVFLLHVTRTDSIAADSRDHHHLEDVRAYETEILIRDENRTASCFEE